jgi:predicted anti-sigma-YlaC factor YlaD
MDCKIVQENLFRYKEGKLREIEKLEFNKHLATCSACKEIYSGFEAIENIMDKQKSMKPDPFAGTRIKQKLQNRLERKQNSKVAALKPVFIGLLLIFAVAVGMLIGSSHMPVNNNISENQEQLDVLRSDLYISDFVDEDLLILTNN